MLLSDYCRVARKLRQKYRDEPACPRCGGLAHNFDACNRRGFDPLDDLRDEYDDLGAIDMLHRAGWGELLDDR